MPDVHRVADPSKGGLSHQFGFTSVECRPPGSAIQFPVPYVLLTGHSPGGVACCLCQGEEFDGSYFTHTTTRVSRKLHSINVFRSYSGLRYWKRLPKCFGWYNRRTVRAILTWTVIELTTKVDLLNNKPGNMSWVGCEIKQSESCTSAFL